MKVPSSGILFLLFLVVTASGCIDSDSKSSDTLSIEKLAENPESFLGQEVKISGKIGRSSANNYYITEGQDRIGLEPWLPLNVAQCPPDRPECEPPEQMTKYIDQNLTLRGTLTGAEGNLTLYNVTVVRD